MSSRLQASCSALFVLAALTCAAFHAAPVDSHVSTPGSTPEAIASHPGLPLQPATMLYYSAERSRPQPTTMAAHTRAPFVNVYAIYRRGLPDVLRLRAREEATPDVSRRHFLLSGQKTAAVWPPAAGDATS